MVTSIVAGSLDSWQYLASYADLMDWLGADGLTDADSDTAAQHYNNYARSEGRTITFNAWEYLASNPDLMNWLGADGFTHADATTATKHYIEHGYHEDRTITFDAWEYLASNPDLMNWLGADGVTDADAVTAAKHYMQYGVHEDRTITFDAAAYLAANADLQHWIYDLLHLSGDAANDFAAQHYITNGRFENRMGTPVESYALTTAQDNKSAYHFTSNPAGTLNTLQNSDQLTGLGDEATLTAVLVNPNADAGYVIAPELNNIKTLEVEFGATSYLSGLDLQHADQALTTVNVTGVSSGGFVIDNLPASANNLSVSNTQGLPDITFSWRGVPPTEFLLRLLICDFYAHNLTLSGYTEWQWRNIVLWACGDPAIDLLDVKTFPSGVTVNSLELTITALGDLFIGEDWNKNNNIIEHDNGFTPDSVAGLKKITVTGIGTGTVILASVGSVKGFVLDGSAAQGKIAVNISNAAADASAVFTTGSNDDTVLVDRVLTAFWTSNDGGDYGPAVTFAGHLNTGSGNDSVTAHHLAATASITTEAGEDKVTLATDTSVLIADGAEILLGSDNDTLRITVTGTGVARIEGSVDGGEGRDTMIVDGNYDLGTNNKAGVSPSTVINDDLFVKLDSIETILVDTTAANGDLMITIDEQVGTGAGNTNVDTIRMIGEQNNRLDLLIGNNFTIAPTVNPDSFGGAAQTIGGALLIDTHTHRVATVLNIENKDDDTDIQFVNMDIQVAAKGGSILNMVTSAAQSAQVEVRVYTADENDAHVISSTNAGNADGLVDINTGYAGSAATLAAGAFDKLVVLEGATANDGGAEGAMTITIADAWTDNTTGFTLDASAVLDTDANLATGGAVITVENGDLADLTIQGTQNSDAITDGRGADTINGNAGNDTISAGEGQDVVDGGAGIDTISLTETGVAPLVQVKDTVVSDVIAVAHADLITGFASGTDKFNYNGALLNGLGTNADGITGIDVITSATFAAGLVDPLSTVGVVFIAQTGVGSAAFTNVLASTASNLTTNYAALEAQLLGAGGALNGVIANLDSVLTPADSVLLVLDNDSTGSVVLRITNTDATGNTLTAGEVELVGVFVNTPALALADFI
jgi:hypothetical protein